METGEHISKQWLKKIKDDFDMQDCQEVEENTTLSYHHDKGSDLVILNRLTLLNMLQNTNHSDEIVQKIYNNTAQALDQAVEQE